MILKEINIFGFKSFPNKSQLKFSFPIVAIVGPNGSGKSNVAEAFRFVLGEQSKKNLRSKNAEDLIWAGNSFKPRLNRASVSILFDNKDKVFDTDFDELRIERVVYRDGANEYFINDSQVRLKDIHELLASAKLGASSHHIISQGEADDMLNASDKDRLLMIKDALGLGKYQIKLKDAKRKLGRTEENMKEAQIRLRELRPQLRFLEAQIAKKEEIDFLKEELALAFASFIYFKKQHYAKERAELLQELSRAKAKHDSADQALRHFKRAEDNPELLNLKTKLQSLGEEISDIENEILNIRAKIAEKQARKEAFASISAFKRQKDKVASFRISAELFSKLLKVLEALIKGQAVVREEIVDIKEALEAAQGGKDKKEEQVSEKIDLEEIERDLKMLSEKRAALESRLMALKKERQIVASEIKEAEPGRSAREEKLLELSERRSRAFAEYKDTESRLYSLKEKENALEELLREAKSKVGARFLQFLAEFKSGQRAVKKIYERMEIERIKIKLDELGEVDESTIHEYKNLKGKMEFIEKELLDLEQSKAKIEEVIKTLEANLEEDMQRGIAKISSEFQNFFQMLFAGGEASLELYESQNQEGEKQDAISVQVQIPGKRQSSMESLSGGERSLVSIALIFAISQVSPPPFIILDETDAALDEANSRKYSDILMQLAQNSQIITITHNRQTMSVAGELYGVTMGKDAISQVLSITLDEAETVAK